MLGTLTFAYPTILTTTYFINHVTFRDGWEQTELLRIHLVNAADSLRQKVELLRHHDPSLAQQFEVT